MSSSSQPYFSMTKTLVHLSKGHQRPALELTKSAQWQAINSSMTDPSTAEADLPSFLSGVLAAIRLEKRSKHLFLLGKQWSIRRGQRKYVDAFMRTVFADADTPPLPWFGAGPALLDGLCVSLSLSGKRKQLAFLQTSFQFGPQMALVGVEVRAVALYLSFFGTEGPEGRLPVALFFSRFFAEEAPADFAALLPHLLGLFSSFSELEVAALRRKYLRFKQALSVG